MSAAIKNAERAKRIESIEQDLERLWEALSIDEKMTNDKLSKRFGVLRQLLTTLKDLNRCNFSRSKTG